jgi:hypothetical protein
MQSGAEVALDGPGLSRRPQLSPSGAGLVVEVYPLILTDENPPRFVVSRRSDLFLYGLP